MLAAAATLTLAAPVQAAEIKVLSSNAVKTVLEELGPQFEKSSGHKIAFTWGGRRCSDEGRHREGAAPRCLTDAGVDDLINQGKLASRTAPARPPTVVAIRVHGVPKPDLSGTDAFKKLLMSAKSISYVEWAWKVYPPVPSARAPLRRRADQRLLKSVRKQRGRSSRQTARLRLGSPRSAKSCPASEHDVYGMLPPDIQILHRLLARRWQGQQICRVAS